MSGDILKRENKNLKKLYKVTIEEVVSETFDVYADDLNEAENIAIEKYKKGEIVLQPGNLINKQMIIEDLVGNTKDWYEF